MKRILCLILVVSSFIVFLACGKQTTISEEIQTTNGSSNHMSPPRRFAVTSEEDLETLLNATQLSNADFAEFVTQTVASTGNRIYIPGNTEKQEVEDLSQHITTIGVPILKGQTKPDSFSLEYQPDIETITVIYWLNGARYLFAYSPFDGKVDRSKEEVAGIWQIGEESIPIYRREASPPEGSNLTKYYQDILFGNLYKDGYIVYIQLSPNYSQIVEQKADYSEIQNLAPAEFVWSNAIGEVE